LLIRPIGEKPKKPAMSGLQGEQPSKRENGHRRVS